MTRIRFSVRWLMLAVAIAGTVIGLWGLRSRSIIHRGIAAEHASEEAAWAQEVRKLGRMMEIGDVNFRRYEESVAQRGGKVPSGVRNEADFFRPEHHQAVARVRFHGALKRKYERAARSHWLPVAPDPPEPR